VDRPSFGPEWYEFQAPPRHCPVRRVVSRREPSGKGSPRETLAALLGHKGTKTLHENYNHALAKTQTLVDVLRRRVQAMPFETITLGGEGAEGDGPAPGTG
jgi:hypothetical protein